jgi:hypothetical protein
VDAINYIHFVAILTPCSWRIGPFTLSQDKVDSDDGEDDEESVAASEGSDKFVVGKEFGHIRLQHFLSTHQGKEHGTAELLGGHCVLPPEAFQRCVTHGWGSPHPFGGRYHPIVGTTIPETTLVFKAPRNAAEAGALFSILHISYLWASDKLLPQT